MNTARLQSSALSLLLFLLLLVLAPPLPAAVTLTTLHEFGLSPAPNLPQGDLVQGSDGNFYGMTWRGGPNGFGTVFRMTPAGALTTLVEFNNTTAPKGASPQGSLMQGSDGNFYGMTHGGGANGFGTVFQMTPAGVLTTLVEFNETTTPKGRNPYGSLVQGSDGYFYGMTIQGGANNIGTVFQMTTNGVLTTRVEFNNNTAPKGQNPTGSLVQGSDGNFYGMTSAGGAYSYGTVFKVPTNGTLTTLVEFNSTTAPKGAFPYGSLVAGNDGHFYGMTYAGGANGVGTAFKLDVGLTPIPPRLAISRSGASVLLSWPSAGTAGFNLEETGTLGATANWSPNGTGIADDGTNKSATIPLGLGNEFFRLRKP